MKVLDLQCANAHVFEGWFGSEQDFQDQLVRGLVSCPVCDNAAITKRITAARLNLRGTKETTEQAAAPTQTSVQPSAHDAAAAAEAARQAAQHLTDSLTPERQALLAKAVRALIAQSTDVGDNFAAEARRIHEGEAPERAIRGQASRKEAIELLEDGIDILPLPEHLTRTLQ